jgi:FkbM family methyltransferase
LTSLDEWADRVELASNGVVVEMLKHLPTGGVLFDIGANTGAVTKAAIVERDAQVYAWEPVPHYARYCQDHNPKARVYEEALGEDWRTATLWCDYANLGWNTFVTEQRTWGMEPLEVPVTTLDSYFVLPRPDVMKIDVEGYEWAVLRGGHSVIADWKPVIIVEIGWGGHHPQRAEVVTEMEWLFSIGYDRVDYDVDHTEDFVLVP